MRGRIGVAVLLAAAAIARGPGMPPSAGADASPCAAAPGAGDSTLTLIVDGRPRSVLVHVPPGVAPDSPAPLVIALHGFRGDGPAMARGTGFSILADQHRFVVAYPTAPGGRWALYAGEPRGPADADFVRATVDTLDARLCIDPTRRYLLGVSNGGGEAARLACVLSDRLAAIALVAGDYRSLPACHPPRPISVLEIHGLRDPVVPYAGRPGDHSGSVVRFVAMWRALDGCAGSGARERPSPDRIRITWSCAQGTTVEQLKMLTLGHVWPGTPAPGHAPGPRSATTVIWQFFSGLRAPAAT